MGDEQGVNKVVKEGGVPANNGQDLVKKVRGASNLRKNVLMIGAAVLVVLGGVGTGWLVSGRAKAGGGSVGKAVAPGAKQSKSEAGLEDEATFRDSAEGMLEEGGIGGEGTHHLVRDGGPSQNVYLTSTVIDLGGFVGEKVKVWGETISARQAGWLMDVGKIKVIK